MEGCKKKSIRDELINGNWKRDLPYIKSSFSTKEHLKIIWEKNPRNTIMKLLSKRPYVFITEGSGEEEGPPSPSPGLAPATSRQGEQPSSHAAPAKLRGLRWNPPARPPLPAAPVFLLRGKWLYLGKGDLEGQALGDAAAGLGSLPSPPAPPLLPSFPSFHRSSNSLGLAESKSF